MKLITGNRGFIGGHLMTRFKDAIGIDRLDTVDCFYQLENTDFSEIECVYHMGAISSTVETDVDLIHHYNIRFSIRLFEKCIQFGVPVKYASSASVYGNLYPNINPLNYYAMSKAAVDLWVNDNISRFKSIHGYRFFNVYGNGESHKLNQASPITQFKLQAIRSGVINVFEGSSGFYRDFISVDDVLGVMDIECESGIYDVGTGKPISFMEVAEIISKKYNAKINIIPFPEHLRNKYQPYTRSNMNWDYDFESVESWVGRHSLSLNV